MSHLQPNIIFAGRYTLLEKLGIGGYSEVWKATDNMAGEMLVALKIFAPDKGLDQNGIQVFSKEYGLVFNLYHANLLKPSHYDIWEGSPYLVMPYCKNGSLYGKIGEMNEIEVLVFIHQAADALDYLHSQPTPIIHQDIKPDNFLINNNGNYLLSDFGISSRLRRTLTRSIGNIGSSGTMAYLPPERFSEDKQILPAGDIFALGVTIYELLTGDLPFDEQGGLRLRNGAGIPKLPPNFSSGLNDLVRSCLNVDPALRPDARSIKIKVTELSNLIKTGVSIPLASKSVSEVRRTVQFPIPSSPKIAEIPDNNKDGNYWYLIVGILVLVSFILIIVLNQNNTSKEERIAKAISDSTAIADSLAIIVAEQERLVDSTVKAWAKKEASKQTVINDGDKSTKKSILGKEEYTYTDQVEAPKTNTRFSIGQHYAGGIVFYINNTGQHGLVCASGDQSAGSRWTSAKFICSNSILSGFNDWYLPSKEELNYMFSNLASHGIGSFSDNTYWSASEINSGDVFVQYFGDGGQYISVKDEDHFVRAVRSF